MPANGNHIMVGTAWVAGSFLAWVLLCNVFGFVIFEYLGNERGVTLPEAIVTAFNWTVVAGLVLVPAIVAVLAIRAYLPGTGTRPSKRRGFPVEETRPSGPE
jgi:uncharacterized membrane protein